VGVWLLLATAACESPRAPVAGEPCGVTAGGGVEQAATVLFQPIPTYLGFVLDEALGGQSCVPGVAEACESELEECVGRLSVLSGTTTIVTVDIESRGQTQVGVDGIGIDGDCGWSVADREGFRIDGGTAVTVEMTFAAGEVGTCDADFVVSAFADNVPERESRIPLRATVVAAP